MELIADGILILAALAAMAYCMVLSRRLRRLAELDGGLGAAITSLSREVDHLSGALAEAKTATTDSATDLGAQCRAAHVAARRLEALVKSANKAVLAKTTPREPTPAAKPKCAETPVSEVAKRKPAEDATGPSSQAKAETELPAPTTKSEADALDKKPDEQALPKPADKAKVDTYTPALANADAIENLDATALDATALDTIIGTIIAKGDADDNAALARRLVMALAGQDRTGSS